MINSSAGRKCLQQRHLCNRAHSFRFDFHIDAMSYGQFATQALILILVGYSSIGPACRLCGDDLTLHVGIVDAGLAGRKRGCGKAIMQYEAGA